MGVQERKSREKAQREDDILAAAKKVFLGKGLAAATVDDIAAEAELAKGTLYRYYRSKEEILLVINEQALRELHLQLVQATQGESTGLEKILQLTRAYYEFVSSNPAYFGFISFFESPFISTNAATLYATHKAIRDLVVALLESGMQDGSIRTDLKTELLANTLWAGSYGIMQLIVSKGAHLAEDYHINLDELFETFLISLASSLQPAA